MYFVTHIRRFCVLLYREAVFLYREAEEENIYIYIYIYIHLFTKALLFQKYTSDICITVEKRLNPFPSRRFPIDEKNRLELDRVKSISALGTHSNGKGLSKMDTYHQLYHEVYLD